MEQNKDTHQRNSLRAIDNQYLISNVTTQRSIINYCNTDAQKESGWQFFPNLL